MATNLKILTDIVISYGPTHLVPGTVFVCEDDSVANWLVGQGIAVVDGVDPVNAAPLTDGGLAVNGDPGGNLELDTTQG